MYKRQVANSVAPAPAPQPQAQPAPAATDPRAMANAVPVSYTHLDVYKRQQLTDRILSSTANIDSQAFRTGRLNNSDWNDFAQATSMPVSYTHLASQKRRTVIGI